MNNFSIFYRTRTQQSEQLCSESVIEGAEIVLRKSMFGLVSHDEEESGNKEIYLIVFGCACIYVLLDICLKWMAKRKKSGQIKHTSIIHFDEYQDIEFSDCRRTISTQTFISIKGKQLFICEPLPMNNEDNEFDDNISDATSKTNPGNLAENIDTTKAAVTSIKNPLPSRIPVCVRPPKPRASL
ncbi:uncharacterized protein Dwil_GK27356, isoform B [Drosophila willistoni]|uniref:Uncharacterized protein, isoform B n=1 Tax=Drosophila willistoni TaxID=7260 RepID=A0A0Q9WWI0_DROWI|nr:uncharacterized protein LOC26529358 isoform X2 [Drosophila willistoni]KRG00364.1 uncharacterized protein Dwil_GK27356, isoform B [Drosophila willistoni]